MTFAVLFVCTGNICRSPAAEELFRDRLSLDAQVVVSSAGTRGLIDWPIDPPTARALEELGVDTQSHRARRLDREMLRASDLVLTAAMDHRASVLRTEPSLMARTFTLREFARLAKEAPEGRPVGVPTADDLRLRVAAVARQRGFTGPAGPAENDIADPYGAPFETARATVSQISQLVDVVLDGLALGRTGDPQIRD